MKNVIKLLFLLGIIYLVGMGCQENLITQDELGEFNTSVNKVRIPGDTEITKISKNENYLSLPADIFFVAIKSEKEAEAAVLELGGVGVSCKCGEGSDCGATVMGGEYACVMRTDGAGCILSTIKKNKWDKSSQGDLIHIKGLVNYNQGITFLTERLAGDFIENGYPSTKNRMYDNAFGELFELERVRHGILEFYSELYRREIPQFIIDNDTELPGNYSYAMVNLYGNIVAMPFPNDRIEEQRMAGLIVLESRVTCKCHEGNGCVKKTGGLGSVKYCDATDCTDCG